MKSRVRVLLVALVVLTTATREAVGQKAGILSISQTEASSDCIGDPRTPLCALETFLACGTRGDLALCRMVGVENFSPIKMIVASEYVVLTKMIIRQQDIPEHLKDSYWYRPGYSEIVLNRRFRYSDGTLWPADGWREFGYSLKPVLNEWHVVSWAMTGHEDFGEDYAPDVGNDLK